jgi:RNA polymerase sigma-70 factor (ECF subfamily)
MEVNTDISQNSDDQLIDLCRRGVNEAFTALYERHRRMVMNFAFRMLRNEADSADVLQETFKYVLTKVSTYRPEGKFRTLLLKVSRHVCLNTIRERKKAVPLGEDDGAFASHDGMGDPSEPVVDAELRAGLAAAVDRLPHLLKEAVVLRFMNGLSYQEMSEVADCPIGTIKSRLNAAVAMLRRNTAFSDESPERPNKSAKTAL